MHKKFNGLFQWWCDDYPPLNGRLRVAVYALLLILGFEEFFLRIPDRVALCPPEMVEPAGVINLFWTVIGGKDNFSQLLYSSRGLFLFFWVCSILGFLGRLPMMLTGIGVALYWGGFQSVTGTGHTWHLPMYVLLMLGFFSAPDRVSLDYLIAKRWEKYIFNPSRYTTTGIARKLILVTAVFTFFAAGISKITYGGLQWANGSSLYIYLKEMGNPKPHFYWLYNFLLKNPVLVTMLSLWTLIIELASILVIFYKKLRFPYVLNAWVFHLGIYLVMLPVYFPQMVCYLLIIPDREWPVSKLRFLLGWNKSTGFHQSFYFSIRRKIALVSVAMIATLCLFVTILLKKEWFPFTDVPMYSTYLSDTRLSDFSVEQLESMKGLCHFSKNIPLDKKPWYTTFYFAKRFLILGHQSHPNGGCYRRNITTEIKGNIGGGPYLLEERLTNGFLADLRHDIQDLAGDGTKLKTLLQTLRPVVEDRLTSGPFSAIELAYVFNDKDTASLHILHFDK